MSLFKKIPKDFSVVFAFDAMAKLFGAAIIIFLIRMLSVEQYAEYTKFLSISTFINGVFGTGIALSLVRYMTENVSRGFKNKLGLYSSCIITLFLLLLIILIGKEFIAKIYLVDSGIVVFSCCFGIILALLHINQSFFQSHEQYVLGGICGNGRYIVTFCAILILFFTFRKVQLSTILWTLIVGGLITFVAGTVFIYAGTPIHSWMKDSGLLFEMLKSSLWMVLYCALLNLLNQLDIIMLTSRLGNFAVAQYGVAYKYYGLCLSLMPTIMTVLRVRSSKKEFVDSAGMRRQFTLQWVKKIWLVVIVFCAFAILLAAQILPFLNGDGYGNAVAVFRVLCIGVGISYVFAANVQMMMSAKKHRVLCFLASVALGANYMMNALLIPAWGAVGAAVATVVSQSIINVASTILVIRQHD